MTLSCVHIVQYLCVEGGVAWEFIEYDVLNPSDSIPKREHLRVMLKFTKVKPRLPSYQGLSSIWVIKITDNSPKIKSHLRSLVISEAVSQLK